MYMYMYNVVYVIISHTHTLYIHVLVYSTVILPFTGDTDHEVGFISSGADTDDAKRTLGH